MPQCKKHRCPKILQQRIHECKTTESSFDRNLGKGQYGDRVKRLPAFSTEHRLLLFSTLKILSTTYTRRLTIKAVIGCVHNQIFGTDKSEVQFLRRKNIQY